VETFDFSASDGKPIACYLWSPDVEPRAILHIAHGMGEHASRYDWIAQQLAREGFLVFANDHRGHGKTAEVLGQFGPDGWNRAISDLNEMICEWKRNHPEKPVILLGHSMGAMLTEQYIELHGETIDAAVLSGSPGFASLLQGWVFRLLVRFERWRLGPESQSKLMHTLLFDAANKEFEKSVAAPTGYEWLSRDEQQVRLYIDDPYCGFTPCTGSLLDIFSGAAWTQQKASVRQIPVDLPLYVFSGGADPVHGELKNIERLLKMYRDHGLSVDSRFYPNGRHEVLNETNRDEVMADLTGWLNQQLTPKLTPKLTLK
jgi:alpha-beta hydrolase superfamily lysophospholipase